jgi:hypothetical protein
LPLLQPRLRHRIATVRPHFLSFDPILITELRVCHSHCPAAQQAVGEFVTCQ